MAVENIVVTHVTTAAVSVAFINWLKKSPWFPWITQERTNAMRVVAYVTAGIGTIGIRYAWNPSTRVLSFDIPTLSAMLGLLVAYVKGFAFQELAYQSTKRPNIAELVSAVVSALKNGTTNPGAVPQPGGIKQ
jgi:hypothetical protein